MTEANNSAGPDVVPDGPDPPDGAGPNSDGGAAEHIPGSPASVFSD
ncbi:hypothetical protein [Streptomyces tibetensis]